MAERYTPGGRALLAPFGRSVRAAVARSTFHIPSRIANLLEWPRANMIAFAVLGGIVNGAAEVLARKKMAAWASAKRQNF